VFFVDKLTLSMLSHHGWLFYLGASDVPKSYGALSSFLQMPIPSAVPPSRGPPIQILTLKFTKTDYDLLEQHLRLRLVLSFSKPNSIVEFKDTQVPSLVLAVTIVNLFLCRLSNQWFE